MGGGSISQYIYIFMIFELLSPGFVLWLNLLFLPKLFVLFQSVGFVLRTLRVLSGF